MAVDKDTVKRVAKLACIRIGDDEAQSLSGELSNILGWVEQLNELNTDDVGFSVFLWRPKARSSLDQRRICSKKP